MRNGSQFKMKSPITLISFLFCIILTQATYADKPDKYNIKLYDADTNELKDYDIDIKPYYNFIHLGLDCRLSLINNDQQSKLICRKDKDNVYVESVLMCPTEGFVYQDNYGRVEITLHCKEEEK